MKSNQLYQKLEKDFITPKMNDKWAEYMGSVEEFLSDNFKKRSMGLVCDFASEINKVYTAVFPSKEVMQKILDNNTQNAMLFVHHPSIWDIRKAPEIFYQMDKKLLQQFKENSISIYNLHAPLDNFGKYSTSVSLANALKLKIKKPFAPFCGGLAGIFGETNLITIQDLKKEFQKTVGHKVSLYDYGDSKIHKGIVAVVAGGGNEIEYLKEAGDVNIKVFITGISVKNEHSKKAHEFAEKNKINILGGTHYSTEKFACMAMVDYFKKLGLPSEFISDKPIMEDI